MGIECNLLDMFNNNEKSAEIYESDLHIFWWNLLDNYSQRILLRMWENCLDHYW